MMNSQPVAIVTGASRGIGAATAIALARDGYAVCINYLSDKAAATRVENQIKAAGGTAIAIQTDVGNETALMDLFKKVDDTLGPVTVLVNNAGTNGRICQVAEIDTESLERVFRTNVFGIFYACREAVKRMRKNGGGSIVNISSEAARFGGNHLAHYAASKSAISTFTIGFAREVALDNIRVNAISPGVIDTTMHASSPPERLEKLKQSIPMGRMGKPEEVAALIAWLVSDKASYISGTIIPVNGAR